MNYPLVSVVIATYNRADTIEATIKSVQAQDYPNKEVIIVDDGSIDNTREVLANYSDIHVITNKENLRLQKSLNIGCQAAKGEYIARLDDHDIWLDPTKLTKQIALLETNSEIGVVGTAFTIGNRTFINPLTDTAIRKQMLFRCPFSHVTVVFRRDLFNAVGGYDESLQYSEDWDLWMKIGKRAQLRNLADITTKIQESPGSLTDQFYISQWQQNQEMLRKYKNFYPSRKLASIYRVFVSLFFRIVKKDGAIHRFFTRIYTAFFSVGR